MTSLLSSERLDRTTILSLIDRARAFKNGAKASFPDKIVGLLFMENSSRTRVSFEMAAIRLGANPVFLGPEGSSIQKGETEADSARMLDCLRVDAIVVRTGTEGGPAEIASKVKAPVINAGEGKSDHPTQGLLDAMTLLDHFGSLDGKTVAICGDVERSRVASSNQHILKTLGAIVRLVGPGTEYKDLKTGLKDADAVMCLRVQKEREGASYDYAPYKIDHDSIKFANANAPVLHPLPMNRGVEISSELADDETRSLLWKQMENGLFIRMAVLERAFS